MLKKTYSSQFFWDVTSLVTQLMFRDYCARLRIGSCLDEMKRKICQNEIFPSDNTTYYFASKSQNLHFPPH